MLLTSLTIKKKKKTTDSDGVLCVEPNVGVHHGKIVHCHN